MLKSIEIYQNPGCKYWVIENSNRKIVGGAGISKMLFRNFPKHDCCQ